MRLHVQTRRERDHRIVEVAGDLDHYSAPRLRTELLPEEPGSAHVVVDLADVSFIDSAGIGLLVEAYKHSHSMNGSFALAGTPEPVRRLLGVTGLNSVFRMYDGVEEALADRRTSR